MEHQAQDAGGGGGGGKSHGNLVRSWWWWKVELISQPADLQEQLILVVAVVEVDSHPVYRWKWWFWNSIIRYKFQ